MKRDSLNILFFILLFSCSQKNEEAEPVSYNYVKEVVDAKIQSENFFVIIIPVNVCSNCIEAAFKVSSSFKNSDLVKTIVIANYSKQLIPYKSMMGDQRFYLDLDFVYKKYGLELNEPLLLKYNNKSELIYYKGINNENFNNLKNEIQVQLSAL